MRNESQKNGIGVALMLFCALCLCLGQFIWKRYDGLLPAAAGFIVYGFGALYFGERITALRMIGIAAIIAGVLLLAKGEAKKE